ncbi:MAG: hypothetical protein ACLT1D_11355 [[Clostridium] symbiosum]
MDENRNEVGGGQLIAGYLGIILMLIGGIILLPIMLLAVYPEESVYASCFTIPGVTAILTGYVMSLFIRGRDKRRLIGHQDALIVVFSWLLAILFLFCSLYADGKV